jgi:hypothetical protein
MPVCLGGTEPFGRGSKQVPNRLFARPARRKNLALQSDVGIARFGVAFGHHLTKVLKISGGVGIHVAPFECLVRPMSISGTVNYALGTASTRSAPKIRRRSSQCKYTRIAGFAERRTRQNAIQL